MKSIKTKIEPTCKVACSELANLKTEEDKQRWINEDAWKQMEEKGLDKATIQDFNKFHKKSSKKIPDGERCCEMSNKIIEEVVASQRCQG